MPSPTQPTVAGAAGVEDAATPWADSTTSPVATVDDGVSVEGSADGSSEETGASTDAAGALVWVHLAVALDHTENNGKSGFR